MFILQRYNYYLCNCKELQNNNLFNISQFIITIYLVMNIWIEFILSRRSCIWRRRWRR